MHILAHAVYIYFNNRLWIASFKFNICILFLYVCTLWCGVVSSVNVGWYWNLLHNSMFYAICVLVLQYGIVMGLIVLLAIAVAIAGYIRRDDVCCLFVCMCMA